MERKYSAEINIIITLCHIINDFEEFEKRLLPYIKEKNRGNFISKLSDIVDGKFILGARKIKKFYIENKSVIDTINKYSYIPVFINKNYNSKGKRNDNFNFYINYLIKHKDQIPQILELLKKLRELGFGSFKLCENLKLTKDVYEISPNIKHNTCITYIANAQVIPNYTNNIQYRTDNSNYKIELDINYGKINQYNKKITLNSLLFNADSLPKQINREHVFDELVNKNNELEEEKNIIRTSVDLSISIADLEEQFNNTNEIISRLESVTNSKELVEILQQIKEKLEKIKYLSEEYNKTIEKDNPILTQELLENEKKLYLKRRETEKIDWC